MPRIFLAGPKSFISNSRDKDAFRSCTTFLLLHAISAALGKGDVVRRQYKELRTDRGLGGGEEGHELGRTMRDLSDTDACTSEVEQVLCKLLEHGQRQR